MNTGGEAIRNPLPDRRAGQRFRVAVSSQATTPETAVIFNKNLVDVPDGRTGVALGEIGSPTAGFLGLVPQGGTHNGTDWYAGLGEGGFNDQLFFANSDSFNEATGGLWVRLASYLGTNQTWVNEDSPLISYGHSVQTQQYPSLKKREQLTFGHRVLETHSLHETHVSEDAAFINERLIGVPHINVSRDFSSTPRSQRPLANSIFHNPEQFTLFPFQLSPPTLRKNHGVVDFFGIASQVNKTNGSDEQQTGDHASSLNLSFETLLTDRDLVNPSGTFDTGFVGLTADQLALLNQATITVAESPMGVRLQSRIYPYR